MSKKTGKAEWGPCYVVGCVLREGALEMILFQAPAKAVSGLGRWYCNWL